VVTLFKLAGGKLPVNVTSAKTETVTLVAVILDKTAAEVAFNAVIATDPSPDI
jgi:hypothetical protein